MPRTRRRKRRVTQAREENDDADEDDVEEILEIERNDSDDEYVPGKCFHIWNPFSLQTHTHSLVAHGAHIA